MKLKFSIKGKEYMITVSRHRERQGWQLLTLLLVVLLLSSNSIIPLPSQPLMPPGIESSNRWQVYTEAEDSAMLSDAQPLTIDEVMLGTANALGLSQQQYEKLEETNPMVAVVNDKWIADHSGEEMAYLLRRVQLYVDLYSPWAMEEDSLWGIPASVTLAQGLWESKAGTSLLTRRQYNHFGIKGRGKEYTTWEQGSKGERKVQKSSFRAYPSAWWSFRDRSKLLRGKRYRHLLSLPRDSSYIPNWCYGLKAAGYATDSRYPEHLISIISRLNLSRYDKDN